jgi:hypothetical protein
MVDLFFPEALTIKLTVYSRGDHKAYLVFVSMVGIHRSQYVLIDDNTPIDPENHYMRKFFLKE